MLAVESHLQSASAALQDNLCVDENHSILL
jgi:hypothetical protein